MLELTVNGQTRCLSEGDLDEAMRDYWQAKQSGDTSAALVKVGRPDPQDFSNVVERTPILSEVPPTTSGKEPVPHESVLPTTTPGGHLSLVAEARVAEQERVLTEAGFALPPPAFAPGTRVLPLGDENFRLERRHVALLPTFPDAAAVLVSRVGMEFREDIRVPLKGLALDGDGTLRLGSDHYLLEEDAFFQLAYLAGFGCGARYLAEFCSPELRATNVNAQLGERRTREVVLRTREARDGRRAVFAAVSPSYSACDGADALFIIFPALADARAEIIYDGRATSATALWMPDHIVDLAAGDVFKVGVRIECEDTGRGRLRVSAVAYRNLCLNLILIAEGESEVASVVHRGDPGSIIAKLPGFIETARSKVASFLEAWGHSRTLKIDVEATLKGWVSDKRVAVPGARPESVLEALVAAWRKEPGGTLADAVCAVTRAAHEVPTWSAAARAGLERQAGFLLRAS